MNVYYKIMSRGFDALSPLAFSSNNGWYLLTTSIKLNADEMHLLTGIDIL